MINGHKHKKSWIAEEEEKQLTGFSSEIGTKLRDWAVGQAWAAATLGQHCPQMTL